ncbi:MAG: hypothetical protein ACI9F9_000656 [Candidatus Paceibacteria bacterium]|jgi:uncharacterized protein (DUF1800 family)
MIVTAFSVSLLLFVSAPIQGMDAPLTRRERAVHLLSRFAFGPRPGDVARMMESDEGGWIKEQLDPRARGPKELAKRLGTLETHEMSPSAVYRFTDYALPANPTREDRQLRSRKRQIPMLELEEAISFRQVLADDQLEEVLCEFWRNHFNVSYTKGWPAGLYIPDYDARVICDHALGTFPDLLGASAHHPAMMHYLDNALSRRPPSGAELAKISQNVRTKTGSKELAAEAALIASSRGVNENYARELLELHTLGVDRSYTQKDVIAAAEALTGWGLMSGAEMAYGFEYEDERHMSGNRSFLGNVLREDRKHGSGQGERLLEILAKHKDTSHFIATKLVRYLVNDQPPDDLVDTVAAVYRKKIGDIPSMVRAILDSEEFWQRRNYQAKFKTPNEFLISAIRITGAEISSHASLRDALRQMGQPTYHCDDPTGYYDTADAWLDPGVMAKRWDIALRLAAGDLEGVAIPAEFFGSLAEDESTRGWMRDMVQRVLPGGASSRTLAMVDQIVRNNTREGATPRVELLGPQVLGLLLGSPEFQKQ